MQKVFTVEGMNCEHCARSIERAVKKAPGVLAAAVDFPAKKLVVQLSADALSRDVIDRVEKAGFRAVG